MISIFVNESQICCSFAGSPVFADIILLLKNAKCRYNPSKKYWIIPSSKYKKVCEELQDLDVLQISAADERAIEQLSVAKIELKLSETRMTFHPELLRYPPFVGKTPYEDFQLRDILKAINRNRYGLFLDMGLGKAYIAAAIIAHLRHYNLANKVLLISSKIGAVNMVHELRKFIVNLDPNEIVILNGLANTKKEDREVFKPEAKIVITNYGTFRHICDYYNTQKRKKTEKDKKKKGYRKAPISIKEWLGDSPGILLLDESHNIGNPKSEQTKKLLMHVPFFSYRYEFSGTPADKPEKLYTQLKILDNSLVNNLSYEEWLDVYNETGNDYSKYAINPEKWRHDKLQELNARVIKDYAVYRSSEDCLDLPPNRIKKLYVNLSSTHRSIYQSFVKVSLDSIKEKTGYLGTRDIVNAFPYMQMALDNPSLLLTHSDLLSTDLQTIIQNFNFEKDNLKTELLLDILEEKIQEKKEKGIIWIYHPDTANKLLKILESYNPLVITGETDDVEREAILERFKTQEKHPLLIASIPVLNTSITLTEATFQVYFERVYNFSQYWQSIARIHRIGKKATTITYVLIFSESIDIALDVNLETKDSLNSKLLSKNFISLQDWKRIFNATDSDNLLDGLSW